MSKHAQLKAQPRVPAGAAAARRLRRQGLVPATIYSGQEAPQSLQISAKDVIVLIRQSSSDNFLVDLSIENDGAPVTNRLAMFQAKQVDPLSRQLLHVDFHGIKADEEISAEVTIEAVGTPIGVKLEGGILQQVMHTLPILCRADDLPDVITIDVSGLHVDQSIHVGELVLPPGVKADAEADAPVFAVANPTAEEEATPAAEGAAPEVLKQKEPAADDAKDSKDAKGKGGKDK